MRIYTINNIQEKFQLHTAVILLRRDFSSHKDFSLLEYRIMTNLCKHEFISRTDFISYVCNLPRVLRN